MCIHKLLGIVLTKINCSLQPHVYWSLKLELTAIHCNKVDFFPCLPVAHVPFIASKSRHLLTLICQEKKSRAGLRMGGCCRDAAASPGDLTLAPLVFFLIFLTRVSLCWQQHVQSLLALPQQHGHSVLISHEGWSHSDVNWVSAGAQWSTTQEKTQILNEKDPFKAEVPGKQRKGKIIN